MENVQELEKLVEDVKRLLTDEYTVASGVVRGQSLSFLIKNLRGRHAAAGHRWTIRGGGWGEYELVKTLKGAGFSVENGKNRRGNRAQVVFVTVQQ